VEKIEDGLVRNEYVWLVTGQYPMKEFPGSFDPAAEALGQTFRRPTAPPGQGRKFFERDFDDAKGFDSYGLVRIQEDYRIPFLCPGWLAPPGLFLTNAPAVDGPTHPSNSLKHPA
jgi:hypothetical protein